MTQEDPNSRKFKVTRKKIIVNPKGIFEALPRERFSMPGGVVVPTDDEFGALPQWARVAFAARCARRCQIAFDSWPEATPRQTATVEHAIAFAEHAARTGRSDESTAQLIANNAHAVVMNAIVHGSTKGISGNVRESLAAAAATAAAVAVQSCEGIVERVAISAVITSARLAAYTDTNGEVTSVEYERSAIAASVIAADAIRHDFERLRDMASAESWTDDTPVEPYHLGPLWPNGKPKEWPKNPKVPAEPPVLQLDLVVPSGMNDAERAEFKRKAAAFYVALSASHVLMGGNGLRFLDDRGCEFDPADNELPTTFPSATDRTPVGGAV